MQCLPVAKRRPAEGTVTSWTAEEYLCAVREEANTCEGTSVAEGIEMQISTGHRDLVCPSWSFALSKEMKTDAEITHQQHQQHVELLERMAKNFTRAREVFRRQRAKAQSRTTIRPKLPSIRDDSAWLKRLYSSTDASSICSSLYFLNQGQILILLDHHCKWITKSLNIRQAHVLFGLFAALDTLLTGDEISIVRRVAKRLNAIRKRRSAEKDDEEFIWLDILIAIVVNDYGQLDLWQI